MGGGVGFGVSVCGVCETRFDVREAGEVKGKAQRGHGNVNGGEGLDAAFALEGFGREVRAVGEVEDCLYFAVLR